HLVAPPHASDGPTHAFLPASRSRWLEHRPGGAEQSELVKHLVKRTTTTPLGRDRMIGAGRRLRPGRTRIDKDDAGRASRLITRRSRVQIPPPPPFAPVRTRIDAL